VTVVGPSARAPAPLPTERRAARLAFAYFFALLASYYLLRPIREEMGIRGGVGALHWTFTATFVALLAAVPASAALFARVPRARAVPLVYRFFLLHLVLFAVAFAAGAWPVAVARTFFVWLSVFNLLVVTVFWSVMADLFTAAEGRRLFGRVAAGGSLGAIAGSAAAGLLVGPLGFTGLVLLAAALLEVAARCATAVSRAGVVRRPSTSAAHGAAYARGERMAAEVERKDARGELRDDAGAPVGGTALSGVSAVFRSRYLLALSAQLLLFTFAGTFLYFQQARIVSEAIPDPARRTALFAAFDLVVNVGAFATQAFATGPLASAFGLAPALAAVPLLTGGGFLALAAAPTLAVLGGAQVLRRIGHYALERPARDVLFTVVPREQKYKSKGFIDTVVYRGGDALAAWTQAGLSGLGLGGRALALAGVPLAALSLALALWLARREARLEVAP
jgi:ATP:ADP antiporter, AAA family